MKLDASPQEILNMIRARGSETYQSLVPPATEDIRSLYAIGNVIMRYQPLQNEFLSALCNRIARVLVTSKLYYNPWSFFKKGYIENGETIEEIFVNIAHPFQFDPQVAEREFMKREIPDVRSAFHAMNYQKFYKATIQNDSLKTAFLSWSGVEDLIARIVDSLYTAANYDEFQCMKFLLAKAILEGYIRPVTIPTPSTTTAKEVVTEIKATSNLMEFMSPNYNISGVQNFSKKEDQFLILNAKFEAMIGVEVLASAFNLSKVEFDGHHVLIDGFGQLDIPRLQQLFANDPFTEFNTFTEAQLQALDQIPAVVVDRNFFMIFDNLDKFTEDYNGQGLYWQYWAHFWKTYSISPFANAAMYIGGTPAVTTIALTPTEVTVPVGSTFNFVANVTTDNFAPKTVTWSVDNAQIATISNTGVLTALEAGSVTVTVTSTFDPTKSATATVTITQPQT